MYRQQFYALMNALMLVDALVIIAAGYLAGYVRWSVDGVQWMVEEKTFAMIVLSLIFINNYVFGKLGLYSDVRTPSRLRTLADVSLAVVVDFSLLGVGIFGFKITDLSRLFVLYYSLFAWAGLMAVRLCFEFVLKRRSEGGNSTRRVLLVGSDRRAGEIAAALERQRTLGHTLIGYLAPTAHCRRDIEDYPYLGPLEELPRLFKQTSVDEVVFALPAQLSVVRIADYFAICQDYGIAYRIVPAIYTLRSPVVIRAETIQGIPTLAVNTLNFNPTGLIYKRVLDYTLGLAGFAAFLLLYPFAALAIKLDSPGPAIFRQPRVGMNGRRFSMLKFRTMYVDADEHKKELTGRNQMQGQMFKIDDDPRVTRVGRFLRRTSLDEMPQFVNVMRGEMSIVGTRPPTEDEVAEYQNWHRRRLSMKPGITGLWQVSGRNKITSFDEVVRLDLTYIDSWRFLTDLRIILRTMLVVLKRKGAC